MKKYCHPVVLYKIKSGLEKAISKTTIVMQDAAKRLEFLEAVQLWDELIRLEDLLK